jgi:hypothetical protein
MANITTTLGARAWWDAFPTGAGVDVALIGQAAPFGSYNRRKDHRGPGPRSVQSAARRTRDTRHGPSGWAISSAARSAALRIPPIRRRSMLEPRPTLAPNILAAWIALPAAAFSLPGRC